MSTASSAPHSAAEEKACTLYPQYCFHLSPTLNRWCPLRLADIVRLRQADDFKGQDIFFYHNHPIKWVHISGIVVGATTYSASNRPRRDVYLLDDGSGAVVECLVTDPALVATAATAAAPRQVRVDEGAEEQSLDGRTKTGADATTERVPAPLALPGTMFDIKGRLHVFRDILQIEVRKLAVLHSTHDEILVWAKVHDFRDTLVRPWTLEEAVVDACRAAASEAARLATKIAEAEKREMARRGKQGLGRKREGENESSPGAETEEDGESNAESDIASNSWGHAKNPRDSGNGARRRPKIWTANKEGDWARRSRSSRSAERWKHMEYELRPPLPPPPKWGFWEE